jgi:hypothetical protein
MKSQVLSFALLAGVLAAQDNNWVERNNNPWLVVSTAKHTTTQNPYNWGPVSPAAFAPGQAGVANGTLTVRWIPGMVNLRREPRQVSGYYIGIRPSAASATFPQTGYFPEVKTWPSRVLSGTGTWANGEQRTADLTMQPLHTLAQSTQTFATYGNFVVNRTIATPVMINQTDIVLSARWDANGQTTPINDDSPGHQSFFGSFSDGIHAPVTVQFADPNNNLTPITTDFSVTWFSYMEEQPVCHQQSDWGYRRDGRLLPSVSGYSIGTGQSDLATTAGQMGWDVDGGTSKAGHFGLPLLNVGPVFPISFNLFGQVIEVNPSDPLLSALIGGGYTLTLDSNGFGNGPLIPFPVLGPAGMNATIGVEMVTVKADLSALSGSTQSVWSTVKR